MSIQRPIYLDYMASTPIDPRVIEKMLAYMGPEGHFGNAASLSHLYGWSASEAIDTARQQVADLIHAQSDSIVFTSGATEAINLALKGACHFYRRKGKHLITTQIEHSAVLDTLTFLSQQGYEVTYLKPDAQGLIEPEAVAAAIRPDTVLCSILHANNEIGVIQDLPAIAEQTAKQGVLLHVDAAQSAGKIPLDCQGLPIDLLSLSGHKLYGPKGVGALFVRRKPRVRLTPQMHGGGHEFGLRSGTLATHQIVGLGAACALAQAEMKTESVRLKRLRDQLWQALNQLPEIYLNGAVEPRLPGNLNISVGGVDGEALLMALQDVAVSSGAACTSATLAPSHVLRALGRSSELAYSALRFSLGRFTTDADIQATIAHVTTEINALRALSPLWHDQT